MLVERVSITNDAPAISYTYGDFSGTWESIIVQSPPGSTAPQLLADLPLVNSTTAPKASAPAPDIGAPVPEIVAPVPENSPPAQEDAGDERQAEVPIQEDDDDDSQTEDEEDAEETVLPRRS